eukprot:CAMPEP_0172315472 /NCGR_PEP_ID=MMETSP1058-20130122/25292_1 /TAXON_ID=83371 /ORGANISM="Detonula confervacea, Strain CCMP 353" /LENGTH=784 /DNA_ID=CAMNT_0013029553 /DNA_START=60 /DNA_END=2414 /DNA_ORIENTATION=-
MAEVLDLTISDDEDATESSPQNIAAVSVKNESSFRSNPTISRFNNDQDAPKVTIVNGKGFWKSWTRSFKTTLLKLLDLIDNAVDGATLEETSGFTGRVEIYPDVYEQSTTNRRGKKCTSTTGLCIRNNSPKKIVPLSEALKVHHTTKVDAAGEIGENGIGLKQACAALADLSFVLVKNGSNANVELGIVAKSLQREDGPYLPAFQFSNEIGEGQSPLRDQMVSVFSQPRHDDVAQCIAKYGADLSGGGDPSLAAGIDGLCEHFDSICHEFYDNDYVFEVLLNRIRHDQDGEGLVRRALDAQQKITVKQLIKELQMEIPKTYLHIPESLKFIVGKEELTFQYWQERLVEFSTFTVKVGSTIPWKQNFEVSDQHPDAYNVRLFVGFDRHRIADPDIEADTGEKRENKNASLYFYSRQSGRLIKSEPDARHMLGLTTSSSMYASALTIIIDDIGGNLPLSPTKQEIAFGLENRGAVHEENLFAWVGSVIKFYYNYHLKKFNNQKKILSAKVSQYIDINLPSQGKSYDKSDFTTFKLAFEQYRNTIRVNTKLTKEIIGSDTYFRLMPDSKSDNLKGEQKKRSRRSSQKKQPEMESIQQPDSESDNLKGERKKRSRRSSRKKQPEMESIQQPSSCGIGKTAKRSRSQPISYHEESDPDSSDDTRVKMEATIMNNEFDNDLGCIDLCESSDEEGDGTVRGDLPPVERTNVTGESGARDAPEDEPQQDKSIASLSASNETNKIHQLEQVIKQLRGESSSKFASLESENKALKEKLEQKEKVISVLKRRLGA